MTNTPFAARATPNSERHFVTFEEAARRIHLGRSIAFFGAAFSKDAIGLDDKEMAAGSGLAKRLSEELKEDETLPLELASQEYIEQKLSPDIRHLIQEGYTVKVATDYQKKIACLPWMRCYTTNYDDVLERCRHDVGMGYEPATTLDRPIDFAGKFAIVHLHGYVGRISLDDWDQTFVLTNQQYASDLLDKSGWLEIFRNDVSYADAIFFFGYSMLDLDIARLMYENPALAAKTFIVAGDKPSRSTEIRTKGYGTLIKQTVEQAADAFPLASDPTSIKSLTYPVNFSEISIEASSQAPTRQDVINFLVKGDFSSDFAARDLANAQNDYFVPRNAIASRQISFGSRPERLLVHSNLGAGKTCSLYEIAHHAITSGWRAFNYGGGTEGIGLDIDFFSSMGTREHSKIVVFFENCFVHAVFIRDFLTRFPLISVVLTSRSAVLQTRIGEIEEAFGEDFDVIDLNELTDDESWTFDDLIFQNGLWGNRQGLSKKKRLDYIRKGARSDLPTLLVDICRSSDIFARVRHELNNLENQPKDLRKSLVVTLCLTLTGSRLNLNQICDIVQTDLFKAGKYQSDASLNEFIDFDRGRVVARSATFARAVLRDIIPDHLILETLPPVIARLERLSLDNETFNEPFKGLMRFGLIESIIGDNNKEEKLVSFYEDIRSTGVTASNPQFWLQYAIACMSFSDFANASTHFEAAFGLTKFKGSYDPYQIENQYARFLLESRIQTNLWNDHFDAFKQAHDIISKQMNSFQEGFYPYRVARSYLEYVEANSVNFTADQKKRILGWCDQLLRLAANAPARIKRTRYWREAEAALKHTKDYLEQ